MDFFKVLSSRGEVLPDPIVKLPRVQSMTDSVVDKNGLLHSIVSEKTIESYPDDKMRFRDFSIQTILRAGSIDLLKPLGSISLDGLGAADVGEKVSFSIDNFAERFKSLQSSSASDVKE